MLKRPLLVAALAATAAASTFSTPASANGEPIIGALIGAGIGAAIGHGVNGHNGAAVGGAIGAIAGAAIAADSQRYYDGGYYAAPGPYYAAPAPYYGGASVYYAPPVRYYGPRRVFAESSRPQYRWRDRYSDQRHVYWR